MKNKLVCLDSNIFGWVFRDTEPPTDDINNALRYQKAQTLIKKLNKSGHILVIPRFVVSEVLCIHDESKQKYYFGKYEKDEKFYFVDFKLKTSMILARILHQRFFVENYAYKDIQISTDKGKVQMTKVMMKYDSMILACAVEHGVNCIYTTDEGIDKYAKGFIEIRKLDDSISIEEIGLFNQEEE